MRHDVVGGLLGRRRLHVEGSFVEVRGYGHALVKVFVYAVCFIVKLNHMPLRPCLLYFELACCLLKLLVRQLIKIVAFVGTELIPQLFPRS